MPAYFFLQPTTYNNSMNVTYANHTYPLTTTYPLFFALAAYDISLMHSFNPATYTGGRDAAKVIYPTNEIYVTSAILWEHAYDNVTSGTGYYVEEWDFGVAGNGNLVGMCVTRASYDDLNACGTLRFPTPAARGQDPLNCTGSLPSGIDQLYYVTNSTIDAILSDTLGAVNIRGFTSEGVGVALSFNGTFWANSTALSQLGVQDEHATAPAISTDVWLNKPTDTVAASSTGTKPTTKPTGKSNAAIRVGVRRLGMITRVLLLLFGGVLGAALT
jgi:hypothetical protein